MMIHRQNRWTCDSNRNKKPEWSVLWKFVERVLGKQPDEMKSSVSNSGVLDVGVPRVCGGSDVKGGGSDDPIRPPFSDHPLFFTEESRVGRENRILLYQVGAPIKRVLGKIIYTVQTDGAVHIDNVWVSETIRTLGLGRVLLQQAVAAAVEMGSKRVLLEAEEDTRR
jgi:predicted GNAT family acetyltransferase